ncbi:MAG: sensor histidine kinase [Planctomycetota bacterium]
MPTSLFAIGLGDPLVTRLRALDPALSVQDVSDTGRALETLGPESGTIYDLALIAQDPVRLIGDARARGCELPLVALLGRGDDPDPARAAGADYCVARDGEPDELLAALRLVVAVRRSDRVRNGVLMQRLVSWLAHEGGNALAGIGGAVQVIASRLPRDDQPSRELCGEVRQRLDAFHGTLQVMNLALRPPRPPARRLMDLRVLLARVAAEVKVELELDGEVEVMGDREQLELLFRALLENAREAGGPARLRLSAVGPEALITVEDRGTGAPLALLPRLLEPFYTTKGWRAGLGLPLARQMAEAHGGRLTLECAQEGCLRVIVRLPRELRDIPAPG